MASPSCAGTPKRKLSQLYRNDASPTKYPQTSIFSLDAPNSSPIEDGSASPRTKVAHRFRGLAIGGGARSRGVAAAPAIALVKRPAGLPDRQGTATVAEMEPDMDMDMDEDEEAVMRKRVKLPERKVDVVEASAPGDGGAMGTDITSAIPDMRAPTYADMVKKTYLASQQHDRTPTPLGALGTGQVRAGLPTKITTREKPRSLQDQTDAQEDASHAADSTSGSTAAPLPNQVVDPVRASLTWHEDEITIYDPDDSDDDGTGINGIGFKPTPALAYARAIKRRQQLADYRKREEREARARRSLRRRTGSSPASGASADQTTAGGELAGLKTKAEGRKVRFMEEPGVTVC